MEPKYHIVLLLSFLFIFYKTSSADSVTIHIRNVFPKNSPALVLSCDTGTITVQANVTIVSETVYDFPVNMENTCFCKLLWGRFISHFNAFEPARDPPTTDEIFWLPKNDGLFYSYDNINFNAGGKWVNNGN